MKYNKSHYNDSFPVFLYRLVGQTLVFVRYNAGGQRFYPYQQLVESKRIRAYTPPYIEFANLNPDNPEDLLRYANTRGIPLTPSFCYWDQRLEMVVTRSVTDWYPKPYPLQEFKEQIIKMKAILDLKRLAEGDESLALISKFDSLLYQAGIGKKEKSLYVVETRKASQLSLETIINRGLQGVLPTISFYCQTSQTSQGLECVWEKSFLCKDLLQALYITLYENMVLPTAVCADPYCMKYFPVNHKGKEYCDPRCAGRVARRKHYREKERPERMKKKRR